MDLWLIIILLGISLLGGLLLVHFLLVRKRKRRVHEKFEEGEILKIAPSATFFGLKSWGFKVRSNGVLVLTKDQLYFLNWMPRRELTLPTASILEIRTPYPLFRIKLRMAKSDRLLKVIFRDDEGNIDAGSWRVAGLHSWMHALEKVMGEK